MKRRPQNFGYCHYLDRVMSLDCYPELVQRRVFRSAKDISESVAAIQGAVTVLDKESDVLCLCIGDGNTPRTAVLAAYWKKWTCVSIDPNLESQWMGREPQGVQGLTGVKTTMEDYLERLEQDRSGHQDEPLACQPVGADIHDTSASKPITLILLCVHSHVRFQKGNTVHRIHHLHDKPTCTILVSIPCCPTFRHVHDLGRPPDRSYEDDGIFSARRAVHIWKWQNPIGIF